MEDCCEEARRALLTNSTVSEKGKLILFYFILYPQAYEAQHILRNGTFELPAYDAGFGKSARMYGGTA